MLLHSTPTTINRYLAIDEESLTDNQFIAREKQHQLAMEQKQHEVDEARRLVQEGYAIEKITLMMNHTYRTIQNYLAPITLLLEGITMYAFLENYMQKRL